MREADRNHHLKSTSGHTWQDSSEMGSGLAGTWSGLASAGSLGGGRQLWADSWGLGCCTVEGYGAPSGCTVCVSQTDCLILLGPTLPEHGALFTASVLDQSLIHTVEDYGCSFATSSPTCRGASLGRHPHSCVRAIPLLLHGDSWGGWEPHRPPCMCWK